MVHFALVKPYWWILVLLVCARLSSGFAVDQAGYASLTHYDLPRNYIASCGCVGTATHYPTAALNRLVYGSNTSFGPSCGSCFALRLVSTPFEAPPSPSDPVGSGADGISYPIGQVESGDTPNLVVKIIDLCPGTGGVWCNATQLTDGSLQGNALGFNIHFDLAWPSQAISKSFFPGDHDYGVWNISYQAVSCEQWAGYSDKAALGSDWDQQASACCPINPPPSGNDASCPPYYDTLGKNALTTPNTSNILSKGHGNLAMRLSVPSLLVSLAVPVAVVVATVFVSTVTLF